jgi:hypothetical protein
MNTDRVRIASHITRTRFLHIEDSLERRKLRFFIGSYEKGQGASSTAFTFLDVDDARVVLSDMSWGKQLDFVDFKGGNDEQGALISRVLKIRFQKEKFWIQVLNALGDRSQGVIKPIGQPFAEISIPLTIWEARRIAHACLAYLAAWDVAWRLFSEKIGPK